MFSKYFFFILTAFLFSFVHFSPAAGSADDFHLFLLNTVNILSMFGFKFNMLALSDGAQRN
jgi:hypothetical protein